jgi:low affinity Fe/Cu permease
VAVKHPADRTAEKRSWFDRLAEGISNLTGSPFFFAAVLLLGAGWVLAYVLGASDSVKHLLEGTMAFFSLVLVVILKNSELRAELAIQEKLDALLGAELAARGERSIDADAELREARGLHDEV